MSSGVKTGEKFCYKCGTNVSSSKRMRDSSGRYWCIPCGETDKKKKAASIGTLCGGCGEQFSPSKLTKLSGQFFCSECIKTRYKDKSGGLGALLDFKRLFASDGERAGPNLKLIIVFVIMLLATLAYNFLM